MNLKKLSDMNYSHLKVDRDSADDEVNEALLDDLQKVGKATDVVIKITTAKSGHSANTINGKPSRHGKQTAVDIAILDGISSKGATNSENGSEEFRDKGNKVKDALVSMGYVWNTEVGKDKAVLWQTNTGGNHYNHLHVSNRTGESSEEPEIFTLTDKEEKKLEKEVPDIFKNLTKKQKDEIFMDIMAGIAENEGIKKEIIFETERIKSLMK